MTALVTGSKGFIGSHIAAALGESYCPGREELDCSNYNDYAKLPKEIDSIYHVAAKIQPPCFVENVMSAANMLKYLDSRKEDTVSLVFSSSNLFRWDDSEYARSKEACDWILKFRPNVAVLHYTSVYGPGMKRHTVLPKLIDLARKHEPIVLHGDGARTQNFVYIDDVVEANLLSNETTRAIMHRGDEGLFCTIGGETVSMLKLAEAVTEFYPTDISFSSVGEIGISMDGPEGKTRLIDGLNKWFQETDCR
jgi:nucleoside-diphosphate-sugar epimerase